MPYEKQMEFHRSKAKYRLFSGGVGSGKTVAGTNELIKECMTAQAGAWYAMAAPTYKMLTNVTIREFLKWCPRGLIQKYNKSEQIITLINDVSVIGIAGDREDTIDRARGLSLAGVYGTKSRDRLNICTRCWWVESGIRAEA